MPENLRRTRRASLISPLIDVVLGAFLALFVLFSAFIIVRPDPEPIRFLAEVQPPPAIAGQSYLFTFPVTGGAGERDFELAGDLPPDLAFEAASGTVYGFVQPASEPRTPPLQLTVAVQDPTGHDERQAQLQVFPGAVPHDPERPEFRLLPPEGRLPPGRVARAYAVALGALGGVEPYLWSAQGFPPGLRIEDGMLQGVPAEAGGFTGTVDVRHSAGRFLYRGQVHAWAGGDARGTFDLEIQGPLHVTARFPPGRVGEPYLAGLLADRLLADEVIEWERLPPGLEVSGSGLLLSGVPTEVGTFSPAYRVRTEGDGDLAGGVGEMVILPPVETALGPVTFQVWLGGATRHLLPVRGLLEPLTFDVDGELPEGLEIRDGYLTGTPQQAGLSTVRVTATDPAGTSVTGEITIRVGPRF